MLPSVDLRAARETPSWHRIGTRRLQRLFCEISLFIFCLLLFFGAAPAAQAALQFDVFLGFDGTVPESSWFPVVCEVKNDGPPFTATIELNSGDYAQGQTRRIVVELPTGTLKRFVIPEFSTARGYGATWNLRLLDERGHIRAEQSNLRPNRQVAMGVPLIGSLPRTSSGAPVLRPILSQNKDLQPASARMLSQIFPDNPLVLEAMDCLYLNSEKAAELSQNQVNALFRWLNAGGHLIVAVEQISEVDALPWLKSVFPCELKEMQGVQSHPELQAWLRSASWATNFNYSAHLVPSPYGAPARRNTPRPGIAANNPFSDLPDDFTFEAAEIQVAVGAVKDGRVDVAVGDKPLIVTANCGRGRVTALLFSPEREPFRSWKNLPTFWAKVTEVPGAWYTSPDYNQQTGWSSDGIFGAMIDTRQVHKLPVGWLLLLLIVYLVVIGPLDQFWLKRIGKPMLTWITFPCYVVLFSLVIYFIGYKLRAGESEWNELHVVDVLLNGEHAELRGRTYASVYSPANQRYLVESQQRYATLRGEFIGGWNANQSNERATVMQDGDSFKAEIFVPVWTSQLFVSDWWQAADVPVTLGLTSDGEGWQVTVENKTDRKLTDTKVVIEESVFTLGEVPEKEAKTFKVTKGQGVPVRNFVANYGSGFQGAVQNRQRAFAATESGHLDDKPNSTVATSFISQMDRQQAYMNNFVAPPGLDLSSIVERGEAVLFAWAGNYSPVKPLYQFSPRRSHHDTMWRVSAPVP